MKINAKKYKTELIPVDGNALRMHNGLLHGDVIIYRGVMFKFNSVGYKCKDWFQTEIINPKEMIDTKMKIPRSFLGFPVDI